MICTSGWGKSILISFSLFIVGITGCRHSAPSAGKERAPASLRQAFEGEFLMGAALSRDQVTGERPDAMAIVEKHFNTITPENLLKWENVHPEPGVYNFDPADQYAELGEANDMFIVGHTLVWHNQTPDWVFSDDEGHPLSRQALLERMKKHIQAVVGRYKGRIDGWDVVNEALNEDGTWRETLWYNITGVDYIEEAFRAARQADPAAELYYNDYNLWKPAKREGAVRLIKDLRSKGVEVDGIGMQGHWDLGYPPVEQIGKSIVAFSQLGLKVMITELDIDVLEEYEDTQSDPYQNGLPDSVQARLTERYVNIFKLLMKHGDEIDRVTFWGVNDRQSWLNNWPVRGRTNYPLLFDRQNQPKEALGAVLELAAGDTSAFEGS